MEHEQKVDHCGPFETDYRGTSIVTTLLLLFLVFACKCSASTHQPPKPHQIELGVYLTSLYDVNSSSGTFGADLWIWSRSSPRADFKLPQVEVNYPSSKFVDSYRYSNTYPLNRLVYQQRKLHGTFLHDYDIGRFPFDTQILRVHFENIDAHSGEMVFVPDQQSGFDKSITIDGWKIISVETKISEKGYGSNFGWTPNDTRIAYSRLTLDITLQRDTPFLFFKVTLGLFAAVLLALISCFMRIEDDGEFGARVGLLGGTLLAVVVNQQFADAKSGETTTVTLIDSLHMLGLVVILVLFLGTMLSRHFTTHTVEPQWVKRFDRLLPTTMLLLFSIASVLLTLKALNN